MSDAKSRYGAADVRYVSAFQPEAAPPMLRYALAVADTVWNPADPERLTVLDIGCGRGVTAALLAAANPGWEVIGLDLQPAHVAEARELAAAAGLPNLRFLEADLAEPTEEGWARLLPEVDVVICYGVWTWVPDIVREGILRLLKSRVKAGGVVLMGYNALPGFADCIVLQRLMDDIARAVSGTPEERGSAALEAIAALRAAGASYLPEDAVFERLVKAARRAPAYMVHEWLTSFWRPVFHADLAREMTRARLDYGGTANPGRSLPALQLSPEQREAVAALPEGVPRETLSDLFIGRRFRTDIFVRGRRPGGRRMLAGLRLMPNAAPEAMEIEVPTKVGPAVLPPEIVAPIAAAFAKGPQRMGDIAALPELRELNAAELAVMLVESHSALPMWRDVPGPGPATAAARRCTAALLDAFAREGVATGVFGAPVPALGSAIVATTSDLAVIAALQDGVAAEPAALAERLLDAGAPPDVRAQGIEAITRLLDRRLFAWRMMGLV
ncbi:methyltransferase domain-containing protein [Roseomonas alkaliterrae]|uniref:SAM-dependent methyltransferase n=1 Tax=Neoroseomonas alkaliterrae TaxID=1452450 RepID=A0A840Y2N5_9PROT|nr:class I SAM-dependent methyltransferase [Neoroseomonas alkaliterrae]MBB5690637.1 SAM-dependent methyltransferase [Neoroseomonas alkaliterrae]MBR0677931.1 methyltransferase domain-containing protein [Neoroseomonas alkaliterrae]